MQHRVGTGQAHGAGEHLAPLLQRDPCGLQGVLGLFRLLRQEQRGTAGQVAGAAFLEQLLAQGLLQPAHRAEHGGDVHLQQLGGPRQAAATDQGEHQGEVAVLEAIARSCNDQLCFRQY